MLLQMHVLCAVSPRIFSRSCQCRRPSPLLTWQRHEKVYNMAERLTLIKYRFTLIGISLFTYSLAVQLPLLKGQHGRTGRNTLQPWVNNSLTLNLIVCQKRQLNQGRISLLKRKAQHRRKRIQRKKHGKVKTQRARFTEPGFFLRFCWSFGLRLLAPSFSSSD